MATADQHQAHEAGHPSSMRYVQIAIVLLVITIVEVAVVIVESLGSLLVPILLILSTAKFALVIGYYMHLKFDARLFSALFIGGLLLAIAVMLALIALFNNFTLPA